MKLNLCVSKDKFEAEIGDKLTSSDLSAFRDLLSEIKKSACRSVVLDFGNLDWIDFGRLGNVDTRKGTGGEGRTDARSPFAPGARQVIVGTRPLRQDLRYPGLSNLRLIWPTDASGSALRHPGQAKREPGSQKDRRFNLLRSRIRLRLSGKTAAAIRWRVRQTMPRASCI